jgi:type I restriction enzyme S subunit
VNQLNLDTWTQGLLGELIVVERGSSPRPIVNYVTNSDDGVNWVKIGDTKEGQKYVKKTKEKITKEGALKSRYVAKGDFILSNSMSFGRPYIMDIEGYIHDGWFALRLPKQINTDFFYYLLSSTYIKDQINLLAVGGVVKNISGDLVKKVSLPLPPSAEQKVIADKLDTLLAQVETTTARLDRIPQILLTFRQSVLAAAVSGKLTEEWREGKDGYLWDVVTLGEVIGTIGQGWSPKCHNEPVTDEQWGVIKTSAVQRIEFIQEENKRLPKSLALREHLKVVSGDILTTRAGPRVRCGVTCYVEKISSNLMICDKVYRYQVAEGKGVSKFLAMQLNSLSVLDNIEELKTGISESGMNLTQSKFKLLELNWPSIKEQTEIVRRVEQLFAHADKIEQQVQAAQQRVNNLTQSILAKAFRGELTTEWRKDNPDLITGDNSAKALLAKIKSAKEALKPIKKVRKKKVII